MLTETTAPVFGEDRVTEADADLTRQHEGEPQGERIIVYGQVVEDDRRPVPNTLVEVWQANAAGRYRHAGDQHPAPLDPNFSGGGRCLTDAEGRFRFITIKPGAYPWGNHHNAWRPAHIHFSVFGRAFVQRLVTQMYFPGDPLFFQDPIFNSVPDPAARERMICRFDLEQTRPEWALAYQFDIVLRGADATPMEEPLDAHHAVADGRALLRHRAALRRRALRRPRGHARRGLAARARARRRRRPGARRAGRELAGRPRRARSAATSAASGARAPTTRAAGRSSPSSRGRSPAAPTRPAGAPRRPRHLRPRAAAPGRHPPVLRRRGAGQRRRSRCSRASTSRRARRSSPSRVDDGYELDIHLQGPHETTFFAV